MYIYIYNFFFEIFIGTNFTSNVIENPEKIYMDDIVTRRTGEPDKIKITRQPSQGEGYWLRKIHILGSDNDDLIEGIFLNINLFLNDNKKKIFLMFSIISYIVNILIFVLYYYIITIIIINVIFIINY